ncbi:MAG: glycosyltransferase [Candidatus Omnitrophica bacterium]|nr:glycosyltransferase [Candidatus Omnitrophota bacterium]
MTVAETNVNISILIITRDRHYVVGECLEALHPQLDFNRHEVVVVDSSPARDTENIMSKFSWARYFRISLPLGTRPQSYSFGARQCRGKIIAMLDDDSIVFPAWLERIETLYNDQKIGAVGGRVLPKNWDNKRVDKKEDGAPIGLLSSSGDIMSNLYLDPELSREVDILRGCNMSVRRNLLEQMNYFDHRFRGQNCRVEDDICLWVRRMGFKVIFEPKAVVCHRAEERPDIPRSEFNLRSEFYVWRNTVWLYAKHFGLFRKTMVKIGLSKPLLTCFRRVFGGSLKSPRVNHESFKYLPAACAGIVGGIWGVLMSCIYYLQDRVFARAHSGIPKFGEGNLIPYGDSGVVREYSINR